jgi:hypothetical protein
VNERRPDIRLLPLVSGGAAVILAVAAGIGLWASARGHVARVAGVDPGSPATTEAVTGGSLAAGTITATRPATTARADETIDLVKTPEQAVRGLDPVPASSDQEMYAGWRQAHAAAGSE